MRKFNIVAYIYTDTEPKESILILNSKFNMEKQCTNALEQPGGFLKASKQQQQNTDCCDSNRSIRHMAATLQVKISDRKAEKSLELSGKSTDKHMNKNNSVIKVTFQNSRKK